MEHLRRGFCYCSNCAFERFFRLSLMVSRILRTAFSVVSQSIQASVTETPYFRSHRLGGILWLPAPILLSTIKPMIDWLPSRIWLATLSITRVCNSWFLLELAWLQSTIMLGVILALASSCSHTATLTES